MNIELSVPVRKHSKPGAASLRVGSTLLCLLLGISLFSRLVLNDPNAQVLSEANQPPLSEGHLLGTDVLGRDLLSWCANGIAISIGIGTAVMLSSALVGAFIGMFAGYMRGWVDSVLMRLVDLQLAVPPLLIFLAASMLIQPSIATMITLLASVGWVPYARLVRATVLVERERGYIAAARLAGASRISILFRHLMPASSTPIIVFASLHIGFVMLAEAALSFLGLGLEPPTPSLGYMISQGRDQLAGTWWIATIPGVVIVLLVVSANLVGDGLRDRLRTGVGGT